MVGKQSDGGLELHATVFGLMASGGHGDGIDIARLCFVELFPVVCAAGVVAALAVEEELARPRLVVSHRQDEVLCGEGDGAWCEEKSAE